MGLPWGNMYILKMFMSPYFLLLGVGYALEGRRRAYLGGTSLGLFIDIGSNPPSSCQRDLKLLRAFLDGDKAVIESVPQIAWPLIGPWIDHHNAQECFYEIAQLLCLQKAGIEKLPETCEECWATAPK